MQRIVANYATRCALYEYAPQDWRKSEVGHSVCLDLQSACSHQLPPHGTRALHCWELNNNDIGASSFN